MPPRRPELVWNDVTVEKLAGRGLLIYDALDVAHGRHKLFHQKAGASVLPDGRLKTRPARRLMIGPDRGNRLLTFVLEYPDEDGRSHVVTGWHSDAEEITMYSHPGGSPQ